jgi:hypothetical protein
MLVILPRFTLFSFEDFAKEKWWQQFAAYRMRLDCFIAKNNFSDFF